ncbi:TolC family protein [Poseidonibacter lekithochrous]|uniref:TolC family protein n=1 Tax=Poseidonibacter lekithochrous TaxID=1904463 RepID=UPI0008FCA1F9|nr:TolC family protein [Poseidonibacter lekithochrous]QKJ21435.1 outer membrane efflux protein, TolC family, putative CusC [Poseidonibacter lekithochrous]
MKKIACLLSLLVSSSFAISLDEMVDNAFQNNQNLLSIEKAISIADENIKLSTKWKNPTLTLGVNDIHFDEPTKRDLEPMQAQYIGFSQVIPVGNKLDIKKSIAKKDRNIISYSLEDKKLILESKIYELSYNILILEQRLILLHKFEKNIKKIEKLSNALYSHGKSNQNEILNAKIAYSNIQIQKQNLKNSIDNLYIKLEQITYEKVDKIDASLDVKELVLSMDIQNHPKIKMQKINTNKYEDLSNLELENERGDIKLNLAYFNRDDKYKDYANISVNIPLSLYKTEKIKAVKAKIKAKEIANKLEDIKQNFKTELRILQNNINNAYYKYELIQNSIIPLKRKMQRNIENYNSFQGIKPQMAIRNLNELITYELKSYDHLKEYFSNYSKSKYYMAKAK